MTQGGWSFTVLNSADWVPEAPFSIQTTMDFNPANPFANAKNAIKKAPFFKRIAMNYFYNSLINYNLPSKNCSYINIITNINNFFIFY